MDIDSLRVFLKVADLGSLTHAGAHLGIPKSSVSRKVSALESEIGARLFHRSTRVVQLTPDVETLLARARRIVREADEIGALFRSGRRLRGRVRVDLPLAPGFLMTVEPGLYFVPAILDDPARRERFATQVDWDEVANWRHVGGVRIEDDVLVTPTGHEVLGADLERDLGA